MAKITEKKWLSIRARYEAGEKAKDLAKEYKIKVNTIYQRAKRKGWKSRGALQDDAIEEAQKEVTQRNKSDYVAGAESANKDHTKVGRLGWGYGAKAQALMLTELNKILAGEPLTEEEKAGLEVIKKRATTFNTIQGTTRSAIELERTVNKYDAISPETGDPNLERLFDSFAEQRKRRGIDDSPPKIEDFEDEEIDVPEVEVPDGI